MKKNTQYDNCCIEWKCFFAMFLALGVLQHSKIVCCMSCFDDIVGKLKKPIIAQCA